MDISVIICEEIVESYDEETKTIQTNFNEKKATFKMQTFFFSTCIFTNYYSIIDSC